MVYPFPFTPLFSQLIVHDQNQRTGLGQMFKQIKELRLVILSNFCEHLSGIFDNNQPAISQKRDGEDVSLQRFEAQGFTGEARCVQICHTGVAQTRLEARQDFFYPGAVISSQKVEAGLAVL